MGLEAACTLRVGRKRSQGKALLESESLVFRVPPAAAPEEGNGAPDFRLEIRFDEVRDVEVDGKSLVVRTEGQEARFELTEAVALRWARLIKEPKGLFEKLELSADTRAVVVDVTDQVFLTVLREKTAGVVEGRVPQGATVIFFGAETRDALRKLPLLRARIIDEGTVWVIRPKGSKAISEADVFEAQREAGLVDTKVVALSRTHTAHKLVVPVALRGLGKRRRPPIVTLPPGPPDEEPATGVTAARAQNGAGEKKKTAARAKAR
jgi:hypothetical protein